MVFMKKTIEVEIPFETLTDIIVAHLYATSFLNDDQEVTDFEILRGIDKFNKITFKLKVESEKKQRRKTATGS
jgi:hypothetical protein